MDSFQLETSFGGKATTTCQPLDCGFMDTRMQKVFRVQHSSADFLFIAIYTDHRNKYAFIVNMVINNPLILVSLIVALNELSYLFVYNLYIYILFSILILLIYNIIYLFKFFYLFNFFFLNSRLVCKIFQP